MSTNSVDWLLSLWDRYEVEHNKQPYFLSGWDSVLEIDSQLEKRRSIHLFQRAGEYLFIQDQVASINLYKNWISSKIGSWPNGMEAILTSNSTASLFLAISALLHSKIENFLYFTPCYFSPISNAQMREASIHFFNLSISNNYEIDFEELKILLCKKQIQALYLTDPIFCIGKILKAETLRTLIELLYEFDIWLIYDYSLGGLEIDGYSIWNRGIEKGQILLQYKKMIFIESMTKRLIINSTKFSNVIAPQSIVEQMVRIAEYTTGALCTSQIQLFNLLYESERGEVDRVQNEIAQRISNASKVVRSLLLGTEFSMPSCDSGYFCSINHCSIRNKEIDYPLLVESYLKEQNCLVLPNSTFFFSQDEPAGFRINFLSLPLDILLKSLSRCIAYDFNAFHKLG